MRDELGKPIEVLDPCGDTRRSAALAASSFPDELRDAKGRFRKPGGW